MAFVPPEELPVFALFKNLVLEDGYEPDAGIRDYEWMKTNRSLEPLQDQIPQPEFPEAQEQVDLLYEKFGDVLPEDEDEYWFDDSPQQLNEEIQDTSIFGETYTIAWLCPPDKKRVMSALMEHLKEATDQYRETVSADHLLVVWEEFIDRILFVADQPINYGSQLITEIKEELPARINKLPNAPTEADWDRFNEELLG